MATYSNWREDLIEVIDTPTTEKKAEKKIKETKVNNKVVINPTFKEAVAEMGGQILEVAEVDDKTNTEEDPQIKSKEKRQGMIKRQVLLKKLQAVRAGGGADITAGYEPEGDQLNELKKSTLGSYVKKASKDLANRSFDHGESEKRMYEPDKEDEKETKKQASRQKGIDRAADKLAKEGYEPDGEMVESTKHVVDGEKYLKLPKKYEKVAKHKGDYRSALGKAKDAITDKLGKTNTEKDGVKDSSKKLFTMQNGYEPEGEVIDEGIGRAIKKAKRIGKRILDAHDSDPGRAHTIGTLGNPHVGNEDKRAAERKAGKKKVAEGYAKPNKELPKGSKVHVKKGVKVQGKYVKEGIKGEDNETRKAAALERKAGKKTRLSPSAGRANVAKMLWSIQNAKSNPQNESTALDANTKIKKQEQRKKDEKEYVRLMAILAHQKDLKKRGLSSSYTPEGDQLDERNKSDDAFIEGETGSKTSRRNLTRAMSSTTASMGKGAKGKAEDSAKRRERHQADRGVKTKGTKAGHSGSAYPKMEKTLDDTYPHKKTARLQRKLADRKAGRKHVDDTHHSLKKKTVGEKLPKVNEGVMKFIKSVGKKKPVKKATMDATTDKLHDWRQKNSKEQQDREKYVSPFRPIVKEADDKAYKYVVSQLKKKYGDGVLTKGDKMPELSAAQKKKNAEIRAKRAKEDGRDATEKASDGRYSDRYSNRGSD